MYDSFEEIQIYNKIYNRIMRIGSDLAFTSMKDMGLMILLQKKIISSDENSLRIAATDSFLTRFVQ